MHQPGNGEPARELDRQVSEVGVRLVVVALLGYWCFALFRPFVIPLVWGTVLAVAIRPVCVWLERATGGRRKLAALLLVLLCLGLLLLPTALLSESLLDGARAIASSIEQDELKIPPAPDRIADWPIVGPTIHETWNRASTSLESVLPQFRPQIKAFGGWLVGLARQGAGAVLMTAMALIIAALLLARREVASRVALEVGERIGGEAGAETVRLAARTIASVANGVVGVAAIQAVLAAVGLVLAGIPGAGLWALLILVLAVAQLPPLLVLLPAILYLVATDAGTLTIVLFVVWSVVVSVSDALLKPLLLGRGSDTPVPVILIGAIGGLILHGLIGLFVGAVIFSTGFRLFGRWMAQGRGARATPAP
jgi:predicted PurR-regulated permease PerM